MADGTSGAPSGSFSFSMDGLKSIALGAFDSAVDFRRATEKAAKGNYESAINDISSTYSPQSANFADLAAKAQANENLAAAARFSDWSQRMADQSKSDSIEIYRDYYRSRDECSWRLLGLGIYVYDEGGRLAVGSLPANYLKTGYSVKSHCNFSDKWSGSCLPGEAGRVRTDLTVDISIH